jgi:hypothetical protein
MQCTVPDGPNDPSNTRSLKRKGHQDFIAFVFPVFQLESRTDRSLSNAYTGNETRVYLNNLRTSMWVSADVTRPTRVRRTVTSKKRLFWIDFSRTGIGTVAVLPAGQSFNKDFFAGTGPPIIVDNRALSRPKSKASGTFLHLDKITCLPECLAR